MISNIEVFEEGELDVTRTCRTISCKQQHPDGYVVTGWGSDFWFNHFEGTWRG